MATTLDDENNDNISKITLVPKDDTKNSVVIQKSYASISNVIKHTLDLDPDATVLPLAIDSKILEYIGDYFNHHKGCELPSIPKPLLSNNFQNVCKDPWDYEFIEKHAKDISVLYEIIKSANYLDISSLMHLGCAKIATLLKGKNINEINETFNFLNC